MRAVVPVRQRRLPLRRQREPSRQVPAARGVPAEDPPERGPVPVRSAAGRCCRPRASQSRRVRV